MTDAGTFSNSETHRRWLAQQATLPQGFSAHAVGLRFRPAELDIEAAMKLSLITLDQPTDAFALVFSQNAFCGAPVILGRRRRAESDTLGAVLINNKIANVCAPDGVETSQKLCEALGQELGLRADQILPSSTGIIGWRLPYDAMAAKLPDLVAGLQSDSALPVAEGIMTTDLYPKVRSAQVGAGRIVGVAKGAGMVEPNMATMLAYILTDIDLPRAKLEAMLHDVLGRSFNAISIDTDQSTSDTVALLSSKAVPCADEAAFAEVLENVCRDLARDLVRNGEGTHHVMRVEIEQAPTSELARHVGKAVVNSPLWKCAVAGNDPNLGRLVMAIGKDLGARGFEAPVEKLRIALGDEVVFEGGAFKLDAEKEKRLVDYLKHCELYASQGPNAQGVFVPPLTWPPHEREVTIRIGLGMGQGTATVWGADLTHEYVSENADYRS